MIRSFFSKIGELTVTVSVIVIVGIGINLTSCTSNDPDCLFENPTGQLHEVTVSLSTLDFSLQPYGVTTRATAAEAGITHIALKVFDSTGKSVADTCQIASNLTQGFNQLGVQLPAGTYKFVAVAHSATTDNIPCATITSPEVATLPEGIVPTLFAHVQQVTVTKENNQSVAIDMGKRINATLHLSSTDNVPTGVARMAVDVNPGGTEVTNTSTVSFNPTTGLAVGNWHYKRAIAVTAGQPIDGSFNILLPSDPCTFSMALHALDASGNLIADYDRSFLDVPFQRAYVTNASGTYFRYVNSFSLTFDTSTQDTPFAY